MTIQLRDKDWTVLTAIDDGHDDTQKIKEATILENHEIRYSLKKLASLGLIELDQPDGTVERVINGQKRVFQHPKQACLTDKGKDDLARENVEELDEYHDLSRAELVMKVHRLESELKELESKFEVFRSQVQNSILD